jgi:hypothetical protein
MCHACPGCALSNPTRGKSSELVYNFPIEAPFLVFTLMCTPLANILVLKDQTCTSSAAVECAVLPAWNPLLIRLPPLSHQQL